MRPNVHMIWVGPVCPLTGLPEKQLDIFRFQRAQRAQLAKPENLKPWSTFLRRVLFENHFFIK
jgi:hypothetical protein